MKYVNCGLKMPVMVATCMQPQYLLLSVNLFLDLSIGKNTILINIVKVSNLIIILWFTSTNIPFLLVVCAFLILICSTVFI